MRLRLTARGLVLLLIVVATLTLAVLAISQGWLRLERVRAWVAWAGPAGPLLFLGVILAAELLWLPRITHLIAAGLLFGPWLGAALTVVGDMIGALCCYGIARLTLRRAVDEALARRPAIQRVVQVLAQRRGVLTVAVLRVMPFGHFTAVCYASGIAGVPLPAYLLGSAIGLVPGALLFPHFGDALLRPTSPLFLALCGAIAAVVVVTMLLTRHQLRRAKRRPPDDG